ncbi:MAG: 5-formyltetrahydrofolate cyclo-ligase [Synechococcus sp. Tobar2m-G35]|nr:5-formyltetrahydrofolate cyclo-ligase [Synechococcus sp. Tobar2m-G35]
MEPPGGDRSALRRHWRQQRRPLLAAAEAGLRLAVAAVLADWPRPGRLGLFWPLAGEPALLPPPPWPGGLALPAVSAPPPGGRLLYLPWSPGEPLGPDGCGIPAPTAGEALDPTALALLLVPALAVDRRGVRLGYGGGWYDRLRADPAWAAVPALVVVPHGCVVDRLAQEPWDVPFSGWISERGLGIAAADC